MAQRWQSKVDHNVLIAGWLPSAVVWLVSPHHLHWNGGDIAALVLIVAYVVYLVVSVARSRKSPPAGHPTKIPDFTSEWAERKRLLQRCAGDVEEPEAVWAWVNAVYDKLMAWKPKRAMEFRPDPPSVTGGYRSGPLLPAVVHELMRDIKVNNSRRSLQEYGDRLAKIIEEES
jgi:hypothetical protein